MGWPQGDLEVKTAQAPCTAHPDLLSLLMEKLCRARCPQGPPQHHPSSALSQVSIHRTWESSLRGEVSVLCAAERGPSQHKPSKCHRPPEGPDALTPLPGCVWRLHGRPCWKASLPLRVGAQASISLTTERRQGPGRAGEPRDCPHPSLT